MSISRPTREQLRADMVSRLRRRTHGTALPRRRRLLLAYAYVAGVSLSAGSALGLTGGLSTALQLGGFAVVLASVLALRNATRLVVDGPEAARASDLVLVRNRLYVFAYQLLAAVVLVVAACLFLFSRSGIGEPLASALAWTAFGAALGLPVVVAAVALPDVPRTS